MFVLYELFKKVIHWYCAEKKKYFSPSYSKRCEESLSIVPKLIKHIDKAAKHTQEFNQVEAKNSYLISVLCLIKTKRVDPLLQTLLFIFANEIKLN